MNGESSFQATLAQVRGYRFGECLVNLASRTLDVAGDEVSIEPKAFDLLVYLLANRDRAVSKQELQEAIWPRVIVTEASLTRCVMKIRRAIGDERAIATVRGHGYRFVLPVTEQAGRNEPVAAGTGRFDRPSLIVLPFIDLVGEPDEAYFSDGITEDIITELSRFRSLVVLARSTAFSFKGRNVAAAEIAAELGVDFLLEGSLRRAGDRIRLNARLVDTTRNAQVWAERYDRDIGDVFIVQEELAATIAATVGGRVEKTRGRERADPAAIESYDCLLRAQSLYYDFRKEANAEARALLEHAIAVNPQNARAIALLAAVHSMDSWSFWTEDTLESQRRSLELGQRAIELDDSDSLAQALYAEILHDCGQTELADHHFRRAIALNPSDIAARALYASKLAAGGAVDRALEELQVAERLDPFGLFWIPLVKGVVMYRARRYDQALTALFSMTSPPDEARILMLAALGRLGRCDEAGNVLRELLESARRDMPKFPGSDLEQWRPIIVRQRGDPGDGELEHFMQSLGLAGWE